MVYKLACAKGQVGTAGTLHPHELHPALLRGSTRLSRLSILSRGAIVLLPDRAHEGGVNGMMRETNHVFMDGPTAYQQHRECEVEIT